MEFALISGIAWEILEEINENHSFKGLCYNILRLRNTGIGAKCGLCVKWMKSYQCLLNRHKFETIRKFCKNTERQTNCKPAQEISHKLKEKQKPTIGWINKHPKEFLFFETERMKKFFDIEMKRKQNLSTSSWCPLIWGTRILLSNSIEYILSYSYQYSLISWNFIKSSTLNIQIIV